MAQGKSIDEKIAELEERKKQLEARKRARVARQKTEARKRRTRHLIEMGGAIYSVLHREYQDGDVERLISFLRQQEQRGQWFSRAMASDGGNTVQPPIEELPEDYELEEVDWGDPVGDEFW